MQTGNTNKVTPSSAETYQGLPKDLHKNMDNLFSLHDSLLDISEYINDVYAIQIVTFVTVSFVTILFGFFFETKVRHFMRTVCRIRKLIFIVGDILALGQKYSPHSDRLILFDLEFDDCADNLYDSNDLY